MFAAMFAAMFRRSHQIPAKKGGLFCVLENSTTNKSIIYRGYPSPLMNLEDNLILHILCRVPKKDQIHLKLVSKYMCSLVMNGCPKFRQTLSLIEDDEVLVALDKRYFWLKESLSGKKKLVLEPRLQNHTSDSRYSFLSLKTQVIAFGEKLIVRDFTESCEPVYQEHLYEWASTPAVGLIGDLLYVVGICRSSREYKWGCFDTKKQGWFRIKPEWKNVHGYTHLEYENICPEAHHGYVLDGKLYIRRVRFVSLIFDPETEMLNMDFTLDGLRFNQACCVINNRLYSLSPLDWYSLDTYIYVYNACSREWEVVQNVSFKKLRCTSRMLVKKNGNLFVLYQKEHKVFLSPDKEIEIVGVEIKLKQQGDITAGEVMWSEVVYRSNDYLKGLHRVLSLSSL